MSRQDVSLSILPYVEMGNKGGPVILFLGGFPDNELSGWGCLIPEVLGRCYRLIFCCFPGFSETKGVVRPWGYSTNDLLTMMYLTINQVFSYELQGADKVMLVGHGIGAEYCVLFENRYPSLVSKLILCDSGIPRKIPFPSPSLKECVDVIASSYTIVICHYVFFGLAYFVSELIGSYLIELVFKYLVTPTFALAMKVHTSKQQVSVKHCYLHYNWLKGLLTSSSIEPRFPSCPVLFMYGARKRVMLHDPAFLEQLKHTQHCRQYAINGGHWLMIDDAAVTVQYMVSFLGHQHDQHDQHAQKDGASGLHELDIADESSPCNIE